MTHTAPAVCEKTAAALELPLLLALIADLACSDVGRRRILAARPLEAERLSVQRDRYSETRLLLADQVLVPFMETALVDLLERLSGGEARVGGPDILAVADLLTAVQDADRAIAEANVPALATLTAGLGDVSPLRRRISKTLNRRGEVRDDATPALAAARKQVRRLRTDLHQDLQEGLSRYKEHLSESTIPLKDGRLVLLIQAGAKSRLRGLVHGRSATGQSLYFEPMEIVESNNRLQEAVGEEEAERRQVMADLVAAVREALPMLRECVEILAELDLHQSVSRFADQSNGRLASVGKRHELRLVEARHPLLDPELQQLRASALGQTGHTQGVVPLDLELDSSRRILVITGPNAGGKTVALKTAGLLVLAHQCGFPVPAARGTVLPSFESVVAVVGDEQDLLADRSTFSARLLRLKDAWSQAGSDSLVLLDELGSGTDPEEGGAMAMALLEELVTRKAMGVVTTHLTRLAAFAIETEGTWCGAMEFDAASGRPTFFLRPGAPGGSEAVALARRLGLPPSWIARAEELLGGQHRDLRRLLAEVERIRGQLAEDQVRVERQVAALTRDRELAGREHEALEIERRGLAKKMRRELDQFRRKVRDGMAGEVEAIREQLQAGKRKKVVPEAVERLFEDAPVIEEEGSRTGAPASRVGEAVRHIRLGWEGSIEKLRGDEAQVSVLGKRVRCNLQDLEVLESQATSKKREPQVQVYRSDRESEFEMETGPAELNLVGWRVEPALEELDRFLDGAVLSSSQEMRVVHGFGTGRLRKAVRGFLRSHPVVASFRPGRSGEGGDGATVVLLRGS